MIAPTDYFVNTTIPNEFGLVFTLIDHNNTYTHIVVKHAIIPAFKELLDAGASLETLVLFNSL